MVGCEGGSKEGLVLIEGRVGYLGGTLDKR
jgi:hypothetical protein